MLDIIKALPCFTFKIKYLFRGKSRLEGGKSRKKEGCLFVCLLVCLFIYSVGIIAMPPGFVCCYGACHVVCQMFPIF